MTKYIKTENMMGDVIIIRENEDGSTTSFMADPANSDYQTYLEDEAETK